MKRIERLTWRVAKELATKNVKIYPGYARGGDRVQIKNGTLEMKKGGRVVTRTHDPLAAAIALWFNRKTLKGALVIKNR